MFDIGQINFSNGVYNSQGKINGIEVMAMQQDFIENNVVESFERILQSEFNPYTAFEQACNENNVTEDDFTQREFERLQSRVSAIYESKMRSR